MTRVHTAVDQGNVILKDAEFEHGALVTVAAGALSLVTGTILARDSSTEKFVVFVKGGSTNENGIPKALITYPISRTGAGDIVASVMVGGQVREGSLVIQADGNADNVDGPVRDQLRNYGILAKPVAELSHLDNN